MKEELVEIIEELTGEEGFEDNQDLVGSGILDSLALMGLVSELSDRFGVTVTVAELIPQNFKSLDTIIALIESLK